MMAVGKNEIVKYRCRGKRPTIPLARNVRWRFLLWGIIKTGYEKLHRSAAFVAAFPVEAQIGPPQLTYVPIVSTLGGETRWRDH